MKLSNNKIYNIANKIAAHSEGDVVFFDAREHLVFCGDKGLMFDWSVIGDKAFYFTPKELNQALKLVSVGFVVTEDTLDCLLSMDGSCLEDVDVYMKDDVYDDVEGWLYDKKRAGNQ